MTTRAEHLQWCKDRANAYIDVGDLNGAFQSMASDLGKHTETENSRRLVVELGFPMLLAGHLQTAEQMRKWINGFR